MNNTPLANESLKQQFTATVGARDAEGLRRLGVAQPELRTIINEPLCDFESPAIVACKNDRAMVDALLELGADLNARSHWWAGSFGVLDDVSPEMGAYLIERGATVDIHAAAGLGLFDTVKALIDADPASVNAKGGDGMRPLHFAHAPEIIDFLLDHGADIEARDIDHESTAAQYSICEPQKLRHLLARGARPDIFMACKLGDLALAELVLANDASALEARIGEGDYTAPGGHIYVYTVGYTTRPLMLAASEGHAALVDYLLPLATPRQRLVFFCLRADAKQAQAELAATPGLLASLVEADRSLMCMAAWNNDAEALRVMLQVGFDINATGVHNSTPLDRAAIRGYSEIVELCLAHGADLSVVNEFGGTPLRACLWGSLHMQGSDSNHPACLEMLLEAGAAPPAELFGSEACLALLRAWSSTPADQVTA